MPLITVPGENDPDVEVHYENVGAGKPVFTSAVAPYLWKSDGDSRLLTAVTSPKWCRRGARSTAQPRSRSVANELTMPLPTASLCGL